MDSLIEGEISTQPLQIQYQKPIEEAISIIEPFINDKVGTKINSRWLSLKLIDYDKSLIDELNAYLGEDILSDLEIKSALKQANTLLTDNNITDLILKDKIVSTLVSVAENICCNTVSYKKNNYNSLDRKVDKVLTSKWSGYPVMLLLLAFIFWLTITGANYPSQLLANGLFWIEEKLTNLFFYLNAPDWLHGMLVLGVYRVLAWVISVMLPPMAIFFPLFTLLEDVGYLPRIAYNLDKPFKRCCACGKQALTMWLVNIWI